MQLLDLRTGKSVKVYSQEMALAFLGCGKDPLDGGEALLRHFSGNHPGLEFLTSIGFPWPSTDVLPGTRAGYMPDPDWPKRGLLGHIGYHVGKSGKARRERRRILKRAFEDPELPQVISPRYMVDWGQPNSGTRLHKIAESIASFARLKKRRADSDMFAAAIGDWEGDLDWLEARYHTGPFRFQWPNTLE